ncbi:MAG: hypothetical protein WD009_04630 [Phycisphaeraceae bacterium]
MPTPAQGWPRDVLWQPPSRPEDAPQLFGSGDRAGGGPIAGPGDPRWVLAARAADKLEGTLLRPEHRDRLIRLGRMLGLSPFDANLVIAIVQDQARRGHPPHHCAAAGRQQLQLIALPRRRTMLDALRDNRPLGIAVILGTLLLLEVALLAWLF